MFCIDFLSMFCTTEGKCSFKNCSGNHMTDPCSETLGSFLHNSVVLANIFLSILRYKLLYKTSNPQTPTNLTPESNQCKPAQLPRSFIKSKTLKEIIQWLTHYKTRSKTDPDLINFKQEKDAAN